MTDQVGQDYALGFAPQPKLRAHSQYSKRNQGLLRWASNAVERNLLQVFVVIAPCKSVHNKRAQRRQAPHLQRGRFGGPSITTMFGFGVIHLDLSRRHSSIRIAGLNFYGFFTLFLIRLHIAVLTKSLESAIGFSRFNKGGFMVSVYLLLTVAFFVVTVALVYACEKLRGQS